MIIASVRSTFAAVCQLPPALCESAVEDEVRYPLRVTRRIGNRCSGQPFELPMKREPIESERVDDRLEVANERIDRELGDVPIRKTVTTLIVMNEGIVPWRTLRSSDAISGFPS